MHLNKTEVQVLYKVFTNVVQVLYKVFTNVIQEQLLKQIPRMYIHLPRFEHFSRKIYLTKLQVYMCLPETFTFPTSSGIMRAVHSGK